MNNLDKEYIISIENISKTFLNGKIKANENITLRIKKNEIFALMGENGAGKSTLMSILFGLYNKDSGKIFIRGKEVNFKYAHDAHKEKIGMVHQHFKLVDAFTIHDNIILGNEICDDILKSLRKKFNKQNKYKIPQLKFIMNKKSSREKIEGLIKRYNLNLDINTKVKNLNVSEKQKVEILKLLFLDSEILIFDEPTAILSKSEIKDFLNMLRDFKSEGKTIILITHKLDEVFELADSGAVIKQGKLVGDFNPKKIDRKKISSMMIGKEIKEIKNTSSKTFGEIVLSVKDISIVDNKLISFDIRRGEIFSIAGVSGNGQSELISLITGLKKPKIGEILLRSIENKMIDTVYMKIKKKYKLGLGYVPEDRQKYGLFLEDSIAYNTIINRFEEKQKSKNKIFFSIPFLPFIKFMNWNGINQNTLMIVKDFDVQGSSSIQDNIGMLSGGNQQKVIIGREMSKESNLIILFQPTRGLDIGSIQMFHQKILNLKEAGKAILIVSYELSEIYALSDTIAVMSENQIVKKGSIKEMDINTVGQLMTITN